jgi:hypothetical protein
MRFRALRLYFKPLWSLLIRRTTPAFGQRMVRSHVRRISAFLRPLSALLLLVMFQVRKCPAIPGHWISFSQHHYIRRSGAGLCSHREWQSLCFVFCRGHQRDGANHLGHKQHAVAGHDYDNSDRRSWNSNRNGRHSKRELGRFGLYERWDQ